MIKMHFRQRQSLGQSGMGGYPALLEAARVPFLDEVEMLFRDRVPLLATVV